MLFDKREKVWIKKVKIPKEFIDYSQTISYVYENLEDFSPTKKRKLLIVFDDMIADMEADKQIKSYSHWIVLKRKKSQCFTCFYITILFQST